MDRLLEIKDYLSEGLNIAGIKKRIAEKEAQRQAAKIVSERMSARPFTVISSSKAAFIRPHRHMVSYADHSFC